MKKGFTLLELVMAMGIFFLLVFLTSLSFAKIQRSRLLQDNTWQIVSILRQAQSSAVAGQAVGDNHLRYGVLFADDYFQEFATTSDFSSRETEFDLITNLPSTLAFVDPDLPNNCVLSNDCVIFSAIEGTPSASSQISLLNQSTGEKSLISINEQGGIFY